MLEGQNTNIINSVAQSQLGHIQIYSKNYFEDRTLDSTLSSQSIDALKLTDINTSRIYIPTLLAGSESTVTMQLVGIDPSSEIKVTQVNRQIVEGAFLGESAQSGCESRELLISKTTARALKVGLGEKLVVMNQNIQGSLSNELLRVSGIFDSGSLDFDRAVAYVPLACAKTLLGSDDVHETVLYLPRLEDLEQKRNILSQTLGPTYKVTTWQESIPRVNAIVTYNRSLGLMIMIIFFVILGLGIANTFLVSVYERTKEFGMMIAVGFSPRDVLVLVVLEALGVCVTAAFFGLVIGTLGLLYHQKYGFDVRFMLGDALLVGNFRIDPIIYPPIFLSQFLASLSILILFTLCAALYPAWRASRMSAMEALRA